MNHWWIIDENQKPRKTEDRAIALVRKNLKAKPRVRTFIRIFLILVNSVTANIYTNPHDELLTYKKIDLDSFYIYLCIN